MLYQKGLSPNANLLADNTSLFSVIHDSSTTGNELNGDLIKVNNFTNEWKMSFNPEPIKQAQEVIFSRNNKKINHRLLTFSQSTLSQTYHYEILLVAKRYQ